MKKQISIASAFVAASGLSLGEIKVNEYLSFEGFVDVSYAEVNSNLGTQDESDNFLGVQEVEIDWLFNFDRVGARVDLQHEDNIDRNFVEQAYITYELCTGSNITAGRYATMLGYDSLERTGLHQWSNAYSIHNAFIASPLTDYFLDNLAITPAYNQGLKYTYESNGNFFGISIQDGAISDKLGSYDPDRFGGDNQSSYGLEIAGALQLAPGLRWFIGGAYEDTEINDADSNYVLNSHLSYETGSWNFGVELNYGESESGLFAFQYVDEKVFQAMVSANYAYSDAASITGRISTFNHEEDIANGRESDGLKFTLAHKYAYTDNLALVNEVSYVDGQVDDNDNDYDSLLFGTSLLFSF